MKLIHPALDYQIELKENIINTIVIESPKRLYKFIEALLSEINGVEKGFVLSDKNNILKISKEMDLVLDMISKDINNKTILNKLYIQLKSISMEEDLFVKSCEINSEISTYIEDLLLYIDYPIEYNQEVDITGILKLAQVKFQSSDKTILEKTIDYLSLMQEFCNISTFIFLNLKCILEYEELEKLYEFTNYKKINLILIENTLREEKYDGEKILIIDKDLCEIFNEI